MAKTAEYRLGEFTFPRGWLMVASSDSVTSTPSEGRFFGQDVVFYRGASGRPVMLDAYCPHMGAHLAVGGSGATSARSAHLDGDRIRCPNHGWRFGPDGRCDQIPYSKAPVPKNLGVRAWRLEERAGCVFAWYDPEDGEPTYELPPIAEWDDPRWMRWTIDSVPEMNVHPIELAEHGVDKIHLANVHGADAVVEHKVTFDAHRAVTTSTSAYDVGPGLEPVTSTVDSRYFGPAMLMAEVPGERPAILLFCHTAVDDGTVRAFHGVMMRAKGETITEEDHQAHRAMCEMSLAAFNQDLEIFRRKLPTLRPAQFPGDGPFRRYRKWYAQFYMPRAETARIQAEADGVVETNDPYDAPWRVAS